MSSTTPHLVRLTQITRGSIVDSAGEVLGRLDDLIVQLRGGEYPPVTGLQARIGGRQVFVPISQVAQLVPGRIALTGQTLNLGRFERRPGEVLLRTDILRHKLINVEAGRLVTAHDIALGCMDGVWRVVGIDRDANPMLHRVLGRPNVRPLDPATLVDWQRIEPFVGHVPTSKLRLPLRRLEQLHPAQIADLVEAASHDEGEEIITAVHDDPALEADVFEELDTEHQVEFLRSRSDVEAARVLGSMAPDDAVDLIGDLDQSRRASILARLPAEQLAKVRSLLAYNPSTAGGIMTPDFVAVDRNASVRHALDRIVEAEGAVPAVYLVEGENHLVGSVSLADLLRAPHDRGLLDTVEPVEERVRVDADFTDIALLMADYNLVTLPVVDESDRLVGVISVDDVLETLIPDDWRRRHEGSAG